MKAKTDNNSVNRKGRVQVGSLNRQEKELKNHEADNVKGGGGARGGVDMRQGSNFVVKKTPIGEEIPSDQ